MAIVQIAVYDALNAIVRRYPGYTGPLAALGDSSQDAAIAQATHDTLAALYPRQAGRFDAWLREDLARLPDGRAKLGGIDVGRRAAAAILALRASDGNYYGEPIVGEDYQVGECARRLAARSGQQQPDCAGRLLAGRAALRAAVERAVPRPAPARA